MFQVYFPMADTMVWWPGLMALGIAVGILTGLFGAGGGFLLTPALRILFGIPYPVAVGSGLLQIFFTAAFSAAKQWQSGNVVLRIGLLMAAGSLGGTELGVQLLKQIDSGQMIRVAGQPILLLDLVLNGLFFVLMAGLALFILRESAKAGGGNDACAAAIAAGKLNLPPFIFVEAGDIGRMSVWKPLALSLLVGILTGLLGVGGGFVNFPLLIYVIGLPTALAAGTSSFQILFASGYGALRHAGQSHVEIVLVFWLLTGSLLGVQIGRRLLSAWSGRVVRRQFAYVLLLTLTMIVYDFCRAILG